MAGVKNIGRWKRKWIWRGGSCRICSWGSELSMVPKYGVSFLGPRPFGRMGPCCAKCGSALGGHQVNSMGRSESELVGGGYLPAIFNLWWRRRSPVVPGRGPVVQQSRRWWHAAWPPNAGWEVELGGRARRTGQGAAAGMGFQLGHSLRLGAVLVGPI